MILEQCFLTYAQAFTQLQKIEKIASKWKAVEEEDCNFCENWKNCKNCKICKICWVSEKYKM